MRWLPPWPNSERRLWTSKLFYWLTRTAPSPRPKDLAPWWWTACKLDMILTATACPKAWACNRVPQFLPRACAVEARDTYFLSLETAVISLFFTYFRLRFPLHPFSLRLFFWHGQVLMILTTQKWTGWFRWFGTDQFRLSSEGASNSASEISMAVLPFCFQMAYATPAAFLPAVFFPFFPILMLLSRTWETAFYFFSLV